MTFYRKLDLAPEELVHPIFLYCNIADQGKRRRFVRHQHFDYELIFIQRGVYTCLLNSEKLSLKPPQALLIKPGDWHEDECIPPLRYRGIRFDIDHPVNLEAGRKSLFAESVTAADQVFEAHPPTFKILFEKLGNSTGKNHFAGQLVLDAVLRELFWRVVGALKPEKLSPHFHRSTTRKSFSLGLSRIFESHQSRHLSVPQMARALGLGQRTFEHQCLLMLGDSPARCFARFKINRAMTLLRETDMPIKEISHFLGFENPYHFSRVFRRFADQPPSSVKRFAKP